MLKKILFLTGTRADFGKLKPLMRAVDHDDQYECCIFVTGMHTLSRYGYTVEEVYKAGFSNIHTFMNQIHGEPMDLILANTIGGLSRFVNEYKPDLIVVHGDRVEALAGAIVGSLNNILVAHIEGGEISGTIDELIRHSASKLSHIHFVANKEAADRLEQLGESPESIYSIGSPDIDVMLSPDLPNLQDVKEYYEIPFDEYGVVLFHPVTTEKDYIEQYANTLVTALVKSHKNYIVIYPNNDEGSSDIFKAYEKIRYNTRFKIYPSIRFEYFLTLLKHSEFIIGNSSVGMREAPVYGVPSINIGTRQNNRFQYSSIINVKTNVQDILHAIHNVQYAPPSKPCYSFGTGKSTELFIQALKEERLWETPKQKQFRDLVLKR
ncbi:UDP-N-acetylglucosamine 2-epimerase [Fodinisporobacter ferrooxydans]|uniref:UDP-N-acetylglucosamine 2-epimerase n=1 Tax=Fodinisporobacter ferrooxydans TaxID=2901836 RepID=A0ABY4CLV9_9BACL|nr:UDP-N-acetylglucosamine 2-epimerase [Alicyclobacillaceae bacterium MYW30-H2]